MSLDRRRSSTDSPSQVTAILTLSLVQSYLGPEKADVAHVMLRRLAADAASLVVTFD